METPEGTIEIDLKESPLRWLASRKDASGVPFLSPHEVEAGERFRLDFTLAGLSPKLGSSWQAPVSRGSAGGHGLDYADVVIAARQRLRHAETAVGPDFASLLLDVCGFLKGIEEVEKARGWPVRTAKVVLKLALAALARSYGLRGEAQGPARSTGIRSWRSAKTSELKTG
ncbi:DNA replication protein [Phreatobacter aquaticus]|uniref:DNA replication protein n=1 Tax=Phreatobacter aquaticus TaxID=2570229 RepID=A0A4D7QS07_9HYPH|nr:DNA replication protein [Phreatobacter aquaticus]